MLDLVEVEAIDTAVAVVKEIAHEEVCVVLDCLVIDGLLAFASVLDEGWNEFFKSGLECTTVSDYCQGWRMLGGIL